MARKKDKMDEMLLSHTRQLLSNMKGKLTEVPDTSCECGKPVVFIFPSKKFRCTRCGCRWQLCIEVKKIIPRNEGFHTPERYSI